MSKVEILTFTDPMMGLSYECEPIFRKLETHFAGAVEFKFIMSLLVADVYERVNPRDLEVSKEFAIKNYNARLAKIYADEEDIAGMPINMDGFQLFSVNETSTLPLNLAYKAAQLVDAARADLFLYNLRYATVVECRPTNRSEEILRVVRKTGISVEDFVAQHKNGNARAALNEDLRFAQMLNLRSLPAYLVTCGEEGALAQSLIDYETFVSLIARVSNGAVKPVPPARTLDAVRELLQAHPLISPIEIREAFDFSSVEEVADFVKPLVDGGEISVVDVKRGWFYRACQDILSTLK